MLPIHRPVPSPCLTLMMTAMLLVPASGFAAALTFTPTTLDFGANAPGEIRNLSATLKNASGGPITAGTVKLIDNPGGFAIASTTCVWPLPNGQSCKYNLRFTAQTLQPAKARLELTIKTPALPPVYLGLQANLYPALNDTGVTRCGNGSQNGLPCPVANFPRQDAEYGRDRTRNITSNGRAGFNFTKLDSQGNPLLSSAIAWDCVRDNVTGRVWQKRLDGDGIVGNQGLHDADDLYSWYNTDTASNGGGPGNPNADAPSCSGYKVGVAATFCNTQAYVARVNAAGWCGFNDWRMPTRFELRGLMDLGTVDSGPAVDIGYFPDSLTSKARYWSSSPYADGASQAWDVNFNDGNAYSSDRGVMNAVRLVRGGQ